MPSRVRRWAPFLLLASATSTQAGQSEFLTDRVLHPLAIQTAEPHEAAQSEHADRWTVGVDGVVFVLFNDQGGRRGATQIRSTNWLMAMADHPVGAANLSFSGMFSAEALTVGPAGYREIFQGGEAYRGLQNTDRQHPHDLVMQLAASIRIPIGGTSLTFVGGPVGEPALGPVPFMHRPSSSENPNAPLSHHIFDSTHIANGVFLTRVDRGPVAIEGSIFHGREPDEHRDDVTPGRPDSWSARLWLQPGPRWLIQASHGFLHEPEQLEPGDQHRTNASVSWLRQRDPDFTAATIAVGRTSRPFSLVTSLLAEATEHRGRLSLFGRFERTSVETEILLFPAIVHKPHPGELVDPIRALTFGAVADVATISKLSLGVGGDVTVYGVPTLLRITHGDHPTSFQVFMRLSRATLAGRMWNQTMGSRSGGHHH